MNLKTITWNIGGGKLLSPDSDPTKLASYKEDGLEVISDFLRKEEPDVITLQEVQDGALNQAEFIANSIGYEYLALDLISESHIDKDHQLGNAIISRHPIISHEFTLFETPDIEVEWEDGTVVRPHDKGLTNCKINANGVEILVSTLHLIPFRRFNINIDSEQAKVILDDIASKIENNSSKWILQGDFNINDTSLEKHLPKLFDANTSEVLTELPTTPKGHYPDHIVYRGVDLIKSKIHDEFATDHYPIAAEFKLNSRKH